MTLIASLNGHFNRADGTKDTFWGMTVPAKVDELWWQKQGLSYTASGYGRRIPTRYKVLFNSRWRRVYVCCYSNSGTAYIGKFGGIGEQITVDINHSSPTNGD